MGSFDHTVFIHPGSFQHGDVSVGEYSSLWPGSVIRGDFASIKVGSFTSIQDNCTLHSAPGAPVIIGDLVTVGHGAVLHGCMVEDGCLVGMNSVVLDHSVIGKGSIVAAGAVVRERTRVPAGSLVMGVPAEVKEGRPGQRELISSGALSYAALAQAYIRGEEGISGKELIEGMAELKEKAGL